MALNINGTTGISGVDGSSSAPALTGTDSNTGINFASDVIDLNTAGSSRFKVGAAGQLGVAGANYGTSGQALVSQGASAAPQWASVGGGKILQVVSTTVTSAAAVTMSSLGVDTLMTRTFTPTVSSSNALIQIALHLDLDGSYGGMFVRLVRDSTDVANGDAASNRRQCTINPDASRTSFGGALLGFTVLDTGISGTSQVTYKVNIYDQSGGGGTYFFNTGRDNSDNSYVNRSVSTLTVMEVAA